jgi:predicted nucleic acid-binding protein
VLTFLDTNIVIYAVEAPPGFGPRAAAFLASSQAAGDRFGVTDLVRLECRVHPMAAGDAARLAAYDLFFGAANVVRLPFPAAVFDRATAVRAKFKFKTIDALHLAAAVENGCGLFLTNDSRLNAFTDVPVAVLP